MSLPKTVEHQYSPIMADIYGSQIYVLPRSGLADGEDEDDIIVKHDSLKASGKKQPLVFTNGFEQQFKDSLTMSGRQSLGIEGCFYTSGLELKYKLQKKRLWECEIPNEVADVSAELQTGSEEFCIEEARAIHGLGKDDHFYVDHWSHEVELLESREAASEKREGQNSPEPEIFADRIPDVNPPAEEISCTSPTPFKS